MTDTAALDREQVRELFDLRSSYNAHLGGGYTEDPYPIWHELREQAPVHEGILHELTGYSADLTFQGLLFPDRPHFTAFTYAACDEAFRNNELFASSHVEVDLEAGEPETLNSLISMGGAEHRRYRALVQPSFVPARAKWWMENWIEKTVERLIDGFVDDGRAELNVDFCAAIPLLTITGSFGVPIEQALTIRRARSRSTEILGILEPIVAARRESPKDDLVSILVQAELADEDGTTHRLSDGEINSFCLLLLAAGSGTTWKQMGITLTALLRQPAALEAVRQDRQLIRRAIEESLRWTPTDPMFSRFVTEDVDFCGTHLPRGAVLHLCLGSANRDPERWQLPDSYDIHRLLKPSVAFGGGPHICLGMHVARAEMTVAINALVDRLPNLRLDVDAEPPHIIGMYDRGATAIPVLWDS